MNIEWIIIRGSGLVAFGLLALATIWGLLLSTKLMGRAVKAKPLTYFHESLGLGALLATGVHMVALVTDDFIDFGASDLLIPGISQWEPIAAAMGVMAFYSLMIVSLSFYFKRWIGHQTWRMIHYLGFGGFLSALIHGVTGGTDRGHSAVMAMYVTSAALVLGLLAVRLLASHSVENAAQAAPQRPVHESKSS